MFAHFIQLPAVDCVVPYAVESSNDRCDRIEKNESEPDDEDRVLLPECLPCCHSRFMPILASYRPSAPELHKAAHARHYSQTDQIPV